MSILGEYERDAEALRENMQYGSELLGGMLLDNTPLLEYFRDTYGNIRVTTMQAAASGSCAVRNDFARYARAEGIPPKMSAVAQWLIDRRNAGQQLVYGDFGPQYGYEEWSEGREFYREYKYNIANTLAYAVLRNLYRLRTLPEWWDSTRYLEVGRERRPQREDFIPQGMPAPWTHPNYDAWDYPTQHRMNREYEAAVRPYEQVYHEALDAWFRAENNAMAEVVKRFEDAQALYEDFATTKQPTQLPLVEV